MKVAQLMATIPDALPAEYAAELAQLQSNAPPMGKPFVRRRMVSELGPDWQSRFKTFPLEAPPRPRWARCTARCCRTAAPSRASCSTRTSRRPWRPTSQLRLIFNLYRRYDAAIDTSRIYEEISARLREELDYGLEARHPRPLPRHARARAARPRAGPGPGAVDPPPDHHGVADGRPLLEFKAATQEERNRLALGMFRAWYVPFYNYGVIHGDPHLGNYTVRDDLDLNLLDFGCIRVFKPVFVKGVIDLYWALSSGDRSRGLGVRELGLREAEQRHDRRAQRVGGLPLRTPDGGPAAPDRREPRQPPGPPDRRARPPEAARGRRGDAAAEFVFMDRAAIGLGAVFLHLSAEINWYRLFMELIADFDVAKLEQRQTAALERHALPLPS